LIAAVVMVLGAIAVRSRLDHGSGGGGGEGKGSGELRLVCSTELAGVCEALKEKVTVSVEPAAVTADRLEKAPDGPASLDGWLVPSPWPDIVRSTRQRAGLAPLLDATGPPLARSPLVLAVWPTRTAVLTKGCPGGQVTWRCWGDLAGQAQVKPGHADVGEAVGVATVGAATAGFFGRADLARADIEDNDDYRAWLTRLERAVPTFRPTTGTAVGDMLLKGPVDFDAVGTSEAEAAPLVATAAARPVKPVVIYPSPVTTVDVVLATVPRGGAKRLTSAVGGKTGLDALAAGGWRVPRHRPADAIPSQPDLPAASGLPDAGIMDFLRTLSKEVTR